MKISYFLLPLLALSAIPAFARDFSFTYRDQPIIYTVLDEDAKTVAVKGYDNNGVINVTQTAAGDVVLPANPKDGDTTYTLIQIGNLAFYRCEEMTSLSLPSSITSIGENAFDLCMKLTTINLPESLEFIDDGAFSMCTALKSIIFPKSLTYLGDCAFCKCNSLTTVSIPASLITMGVAPFSDCASLTEIQVAAGNPNYRSIDGVLYNKAITTLIQCPAAKTAIDIPDTITEIGAIAFGDCTKLESINLPMSIKTIGDCAFAGCSSLSSIILGQNVKYVGAYSLPSGKNMKYVTCMAPTPPRVNTENAYMEFDFPLYVLPESIEAYKTSDWKELFYHIEPLPDVK